MSVPMLGIIFVDLDASFQVAVKDVHLESFITVASIGFEAIHANSAIAALGNGTPINVAAANQVCQCAIGLA
jgi:hypothetical protein